MSSERHRGRWKAGVSGNPAGRPRGTGSIAQLREAIGAKVPAILERLVAAALQGDVGAARLLVERVIPPLKASEEAVRLTVPDGPLAEQGRAVVTAIAAGEVLPSQGAALLASLGTLAKLVETDEILRRLSEIEARLTQK